MFYLLSHKISFLEQNVSSELVKLVKATTIQSLSSADGVPTCAPEVLTSIQLGISYCVFKNLRWIRTALFSEIATDFLTSDFKLSDHVARELIANIIKSLEEFAPLSTQQDETELFLEHLIQHSLIYNDDEMLQATGCGRGLLKALKVAASAIGSNNKDGCKHFEFLSPIEARLADSILQVASQVESAEYLKETVHIHLLITPLIKNSSLAISAKLVSLIVALIHLNRPFSAKDLQNICGTKFTQQLVTLMERAGLIHRYTLASAAKLETWCLTEVAYDICAPSYYKQHELDARANFFNHKAQVQTQVIGGLAPGELDDFSEAICCELAKTTPAALAKILKISNEKQIGLIRKLMPKFEKLTSWQREALIGSIENPDALIAVRQLMKKMAESDPSERVQRAALNSLVKDQIVTRRVHNAEAVPDPGPRP